MALVTCGTGFYGFFLPTFYSLPSIDPDNPDGAKFSVVGAHGQCAVLFDRHGKCTLSYNASELDERLARLSVNE